MKETQREGLKGREPPLDKVESKFLLCFGIFLIVACAHGGFGFDDLNAISLLRDILWGTSEQRDQAVFILFSLRLPRLVIAMICGAASASAGVLSQGLFRNDLASPTILGITQGAVLGVVLAYFVSTLWMPWFVVPLFSFLGALAASIGIFMLSFHRQQQSTKDLLLVGCALASLLAAISSAFTSLLLSDWERSQSLLHWLMGSFSGKGWEHVSIGFPVFALGMLLALHLVNRLDVFSLGEKLAQTLGVDAKNIQRQAILSIALLECSSVCIAGALPFVGLIIPHISRKICGPQHKRLLVFSFINGMTLAVFSDGIARFMFYPREIEVGIVTSLLGAPFFLFLLRRKNYES